MQHVHRAVLAALALSLGAVFPAAAQPPRHRVGQARADLAEDRRDLRELERIRMQWQRAVERRHARARLRAERRLVAWLHEQVEEARYELDDARRDLRYVRRWGGDVERYAYALRQAQRDLEVWEMALMRVEGQRHPYRGRFRGAPRVGPDDFHHLEQLARAELREERRELRREMAAAPPIYRPRPHVRRARPAPPPVPYGRFELRFE